MPRRRLELEKRESPMARRVTFSKRHKGVFKKAKQLSIMCDAKVGVIVFSEANDLTHFPDKDTLDELIEKYNTHPNKIKADLMKPPLELNVKEQIERLRKKCDEQELIISQMDCNKEFGNLSMEVLNQIEKRMQNGLNHLREKQREHNEKIIAELRRTIQLMEEKEQQKHPEVGAENGSSRKGVS